MSFAFGSWTKRYQMSVNWSHLKNQTFSSNFNRHAPRVTPHLLKVTPWYPTAQIRLSPKTEKASTVVRAQQTDLSFVLSFVSCHVLPDASWGGWTAIKGKSRVFRRLIYWPSVEKGKRKDYSLEVCLQQILRYLNKQKVPITYLFISKQGFSE